MSLLLKKIKLVILTSVVCMSAGAQSKLETYKIYNSKGKEVSFKKMYKDIEKSSTVFLGELHNNPISHWFYYNVIKHTFNNISKNVQVGAEMFEKDNQILIDEYFSGIISTKKFETECRIWPNYSTDYKPTLEFCKDHNIQFTATNIPRRYASAIYKQGESIINDLKDEAKAWVAPYPIPYDSTLIVYNDLQSLSGHGGSNLAKAQAYKDATMAHAIINTKKKNHIYFHLNGNKHSESHQAILWYMSTYGDHGKTLTFHTEVNKDLSWNEKFSTKADYILVVQQDIL